MRNRIPLLLLSLFVFPALAQAERVPLEKFAEAPQFSQAKLSPDGNYIAYIKDIDGYPWLVILNLETRKSTKYNSGTIQSGEHRNIAWFRWISNTRIAYLTTIWNGLAITGMSALDRDGERWTHFAGADVDNTDPFPLLTQEIIHSFDDEAQSVLVLDHVANESKGILYPNVVKVSTLTGTKQTVCKNPGDVIYWAVDRNGTVRLGITSDGSRFGTIYRENESTPWRTLPAFTQDQGSIFPLGFDASGTKFIVAASNAHQRRSVYFYDIAQGRLGELIAGNDEYDIVPELGSLESDVPVETGTDGTVLGVNYVTEAIHTFWIDPGLASVQAAIDRILPNTANRIASHSQDEKRFIILAFSDRDPGTYYLLDLRSGKPSLLQLSKRVPNFPVDQMAPMEPIQFRARDGTQIHGYLTLPLGRKSHLPLVVFPHGGPRFRNVWGYDPEVQFLANRGYAVLQVNYRGSPGYGTEFYTKGMHEIGRGMQTDIDDGTGWAVSQRLADPSRIAIVGGSFGGYSALFALGNSADLYRCGVSFAGVTDWKKILTEQSGEEYKFAYQYFKDWIADPGLDSNFLASISPVSFADRIKAPVYIFQGKEDKTVPPDQATRMISALERTGNRPRAMFFSEEAHGLAREADRVKYFSEVENFLAENMAPATR